MVIWSDDSLLVVNKPPALRTIPDGYDPTLPTLLGTLEAEWGKCWVVHRLDKDTSGVILFARNAAAHKSLNTQFEQRLIKKEYQALVMGNPTWDTYRIDLPLKMNGDRRHRTIGDPVAGKPASTQIHVITRFPDFTFLQALPTTGYTHQIRAHLSSIGFPLIGDPLYQYLASYTGPRISPSSLPPFSRAALHAASISFLHPLTAEPLSFQAPLPPDFISAMQIQA